MDWNQSQWGIWGWTDLSELQVQLLLQSMRLGSALKTWPLPKTMVPRLFPNWKNGTLGDHHSNSGTTLKPTIWSMKTGRQKAISRIKQARRGKATRNPKKKLILKHRKSWSKDKWKCKSKVRKETKKNRGDGKKKSWLPGLELGSIWSQGASPRAVSDGCTLEWLLGTTVETQALWCWWDSPW